jgi:hypothetical protein
MNDRDLSAIATVITVFFAAVGLVIQVVELATSGATVPAAIVAGYLAGALTVAPAAVWVASRLRSPP